MARLTFSSLSDDVRLPNLKNPLSITSGANGYLSLPRTPPGLDTWGGDSRPKPRQPRMRL